MRNCKVCDNQFKGRQDQMFCSEKCKSSYHHQLRQSTKEASIHIDAILHRNRNILLKIMEKHIKQRKVDATELDLTNFNFDYLTKYTVNKSGEICYHVYDFFWKRCGNDEILIIRKNKESYFTKQ